MSEGPLGKPYQELAFACDSATCCLGVCWREDWCPFKAPSVTWPNKMDVQAAMPRSSLANAQHQASSPLVSRVEAQVSGNMATCKLSMWRDCQRQPVHTAPSAKARRRGQPQTCLLPEVVMG